MVSDILKRKKSPCWVGENGYLPLYGNKNHMTAIRGERNRDQHLGQTLSQGSTPKKGPTPEKVTPNQF